MPRSRRWWWTSGRHLPRREPAEDPAPRTAQQQRMTQRKLQQQACVRDDAPGRRDTAERTAHAIKHRGNHRRDADREERVARDAVEDRDGAMGPASAGGDRDTMASGTRPLRLVRMRTGILRCGWRARCRQGRSRTRIACSSATDRSERNRPRPHLRQSSGADSGSTSCRSGPLGASE